MIEPRPDTLETLQPGVRRVLANNPSPMTYWGTNTYIVGQGRVAIIDPGPADPQHLAAIQSALSPKEAVSAIFVTHSHLDHCGLARPLAKATGAPIIAFGNSAAGRSAIMNKLANTHPNHFRTGVDIDFSPDETLTDGETYATADWSLNAIWTPGHFGNHMCFSMNDILFSGDHVMGWATTMVAPPDGDLTAFMASLDKLNRHKHRIYYPGHGRAVTAPTERNRWITSHRLSRKAEITTLLNHHPATIPEIAKAIYPDISATLMPAAEGTVFAHLIELTQNSKVQAHPQLGWDAVFHLQNAAPNKLEK